MRTKTMLLSALLGTVGSISALAQTNVYSLNAVGYINVTVQPGYNLVSCPLICSPDNTINTLLPNTNGQYKAWHFYAYNIASGSYTNDIGAAAKWSAGGTETLAPGQAAFLYNPSNVSYTVTFVGQVPQGSLTNTLYPGYNLVSSIVPTSGDMSNNTIMAFTAQVKSDHVYMYNPASGSYTNDIYSGTKWTAGDPEIPLASGLFYYNAQATNNYWIENFSISQ